ncbi:MAG: glycoside hydrolase family 172 protein [Bacteroidota bacterium]
MKIIFTVLFFCNCYAANSQELYTMPKGQQFRISSFENLNGIKGNGGQTNGGAKGNAFEPLKAGESKTLLEITNPGIIQRIWVTIGDRSFKMLRSLRLRMYWDGDTKPAVDVPFGDFFMAPLGRPVAFQSALFSNPEGRSFNCYIPMPFQKGAKVIITNEGNVDLRQLYYDIDFISLDKPQKDVLYFHANWNREIKGLAEKDFEMLPRVEGKGRFLGVNVGVNVDSSYGTTWWGEGEVKMYMDGDKELPTFNGTGTEDYIGTGWGEAVFMHQYQGCMVADEKKKQYSFYRFHVPDQIYFYKDFKATLQKMGGGDDEQVKQLKEKGVVLQEISVITRNGFARLVDKPVAMTDPNFPKGWVNFYRVDDYSATAYFYLDKTSSNLPELVNVKERIK